MMAPPSSWQPWVLALAQEDMQAEACKAKEASFKGEPFKDTEWRGDAPPTD